MSMSKTKDPGTVFYAWCGVGDDAIEQHYASAVDFEDQSGNKMVKLSRLCDGKSHCVPSGGYSVGGDAPKCSWCLAERADARAEHARWPQHERDVFYTHMTERAIAIGMRKP